MRKMTSANITNAKKNFIGVASADRTERTTALLQKTKKAFN
jgi:hypothetical protein